MIYIIKVYNPKTRVFKDTRKRVDSAKLLMQKQAYKVLGDFGKLDTISAHKVMQEIDKGFNDALPRIDIEISNTEYSIHMEKTDGPF